MSQIKDGSAGLVPLIGSRSKKRKKAIAIFP